MKFSVFCTRAGALALAPVLLMSSTAFAASTPKPKVTVDTACMSAAVDARDTAIMSALGTYTTALTTDFQTRKTALDAAWALTDAKTRNTALKTAWKAFNDSSKADRKTYNSARKSAWTTFGTASKTCKSSPSTDDTNGSKVEAGL